MEIKSPEHLSDEAQALFLAVVDEWDMEAAGLKILRVALEAYDRCEAAREQINLEGMTGAGAAIEALASLRTARLEVAPLQAYFKETF